MSEGGTAPGPLEVRVSTSSGSVTVIGEPRVDVVTDGGHADLERTDPGVVTVVGRKRSGSLTIRCPEGSDVVVGTRSGSLTLKGRLGAVRVTTMSGRVEADNVTSADIRAMSGSIRVATCSGTCRVKTKSGATHVGSAGAVEIAIGSGSIDVDHVEGAVRARAASGSMRIKAAGRDRIEAETMSGSITITLPPGCHPDVHARSLSSKAKISVPEGHDCEVVARTLSGGITVRSR